MMRLSFPPSRASALLAAAALALAGPIVVTQIDSAAAATPPGAVVVSELMYNPASDLDGDEFLELANTTSAPVDLSGWTFGGVTATLPLGTTIAAHGFFVLSPDAARFHSTYGGTPGATYTGKLSNSGEKISVLDAGGAVVDSVTYATTTGWALTPDGTGPSLELVDPAQDHNDALNWAASTATRGNTVGAANSVAHTGLTPRISDLTATPTQPAANQPVTVSVTITGQASAQAFYRIDFDPEVSVPLTAAGGDSYTAQLPGVPAGHLLRYRVQASNSVGTMSSPRVDDTIDYQGVEATSGVTSAIPILDWFIRDSDYDAMVDNPFAKITEPSVLAYGGVVYDNATVNIRGNTPSRQNPKQSFTFDLPTDHDLVMPGVLADPIDTFAMEANWTDHSHGRQILAYDSYARADVVHTQTFPIRTQRNANFQGLYLYVDIFDGTWRDREGYSNDQFFKAEDAAWDPTKSPTFRFTKETPKDGDYTPVVSFVNGVNLTGAALRNYLLANADVPELINYAATTAIVQHVDSANHNFYLSQDPATGRWSIIPWDLDKTFGNTCCSVTSPFVTPAEPGDKTSLLMQALLSQPDWKTMYFRRLKTLVDRILQPGQLEAVYDAALGPAKPEATADLALWPSQTSWGYDTQRTSLFKALNNRRAAIANDARVPGAPSAAPNIIINEIQHSPLGGGNAEFLELYNPSATEAVDLSGWNISDAISLQVQPGTVILPHGYLVFVANDPTFRSTYGDNLFVAGTYSGGLSASETITLKRANGSIDDVVAYGGAGWPQPTAGQSLELTDPSTDNNLGSSWALSNTANGSPDAQNGTGTVHPAPVAFVAAAHGPAGSVKTQSVTVPASARAGDTMLLWLTTSTGFAWSGPTGVAGWTQLDTLTNGSTVSTLWTRKVASADPGNVVRFDSTTFHKAVLDLAVYSGVGSAPPVASRSGDAARASHMTPAVTATAQSWVVSLWADKSGTTTSWTAPSGVTARDTALGTGSGRFTSLLADSGGPVTAGPQGGLIASTNASSTYADMWSVVLAPAE